MRIITIIGARPQFIKAAVLSQVLRQTNEEIIVNTGQHYDTNMSGIFFDELNIPPAEYNLNVGSGTHAYQLGNMIVRIGEVLLKEKPDAVIVYGDTNSTLAGAIVAARLCIPTYHIEAGVRLFSKDSPEEQNRVLTDHLSEILFVPVDKAVTNLRNEGIVDKVHNVGDLMFEATLKYKSFAIENSQMKHTFEKNSYLLATIHRAINTDRMDRLFSIIGALNESGQKIVFPIHPRTKSFVDKYGISFSSNVKVIDAVGYIDMLFLEDGARKIITDSGGVQREAFFLSKPCITCAQSTEWLETVDSNWNILTDSNKKRILDAIDNFNPTGTSPSLFGDGNTSSKICELIKAYSKKQL